MAAGDNFSIACMENGEVYTWGEGGGGRLGHGDQKEQKEPTLVTGKIYYCNNDNILIIML